MAAAALGVARNEEITRQAAAQMSNDQMNAEFGPNGVAGWGMERGRSGRGYGNYGGMAADALALGGSYAGMTNQQLNLGQAPMESVSATGQPVYNVGEFYNNAATTTAQGATGAEVLATGAQGASLGAKIGTAILPGVGTAIGAIGVGLIGAGVGIAGGQRRKNRQTAEIDRALDMASTKQESFNRDSAAFEQRQLASQGYANRMNNTNRLYNLYRG